MRFTTPISSALLGAGLLALAGCGTPNQGPAGPAAVAAPVRAPDGNATIRARAGESEIVITTTARVAGAIHSLTWGGKEFIDSVDHGRQLQSASNLDTGVRPIHAETFNPTEAGSRLDHVGPRSTSELIEFQAAGNSLHTKSRMAFWLAPGEKSGPYPARNTTLVSRHLLEKRVTIGWRGHAQVISHDVVFTVPAGEFHQEAVFEALTGYMPPEFEKFWSFNAASGELEPLSDGPGEQLRPVVLATADGKYAMGIFSPEPGARYGRFRFVRERVVKWNCVFRPPVVKTGFPAGEYAYRQFVVVGDLARVREGLRALEREFGAQR
ncbi:MAG: hypothetical protein NTV51_24800 [Verrucomicrobia bacterium]|nr:hypothetical protein [Verrucomicrobiota bacterium]